ncbi:MAG: hypothetical protein ABL957_02130 [Parvularculaceae bacterium]
MTDDAITKVKILRFVKLLDGGDSEETVMEQAIHRNWLDTFGAPTLDGRQMIRSFDQMTRFTQPDL